MCKTLQRDGSTAPLASGEKQRSIQHVATRAQRTPQCDNWRWMAARHPGRPGVCMHGIGVIQNSTCIVSRQRPECGRSWVCGCHPPQQCGASWQACLAPEQQAAPLALPPWWGCPTAPGPSHPAVLPALRRAALAFGHRPRGLLRDGVQRSVGPRGAARAARGKHRGGGVVAGGGAAAGS